MLRLVHPSVDLVPSWRDAVDEFAGEELHGFGLIGFEDADVHDDAVVRAWMTRAAHLRTGPAGSMVPATVWWIVDDEEPGTVLGSLDLRHELNERLRQHGGHVGYGVRPSARRRGVAAGALALAVEQARELGISSLLLTCDAANVASRRTIVSAGGVLERQQRGQNRYWIDLA